MSKTQQAISTVIAGLRDMRAVQAKTPAPTIGTLEKLRTIKSAPSSNINPPDPTSLADLEAKAKSCTLCPHLAASRTHVVFGTGNPAADLMFVGEAPGADEDQQGEPFVGAAGQLLTKIMNTMGLQREDVYIANVLKCRPDMPAGKSGNRKPKPAEMATCLHYLQQQIAIIQPQVIVALGAVAMDGLFGYSRTMREVRGRWQDLDGTPVMPTYHPAYLLHNQALSEKRKVWEDMLDVMKRLEMSISERQLGFFLPKDT